MGFAICVVRLPIALLLIGLWVPIRMTIFLIIEVLVYTALFFVAALTATRSEIENSWLSRIGQTTCYRASRDFAVRVWRWAVVDSLGT